jgi:hypothetical protein
MTQGAHGLSLLFQTIGPAEGSPGASNPAAHLAEALQPTAGVGPQILHYAWVVELTGKFPPIYPTDSKIAIRTFLLTTVYDEDFADYIADLVAANPDAFNAAAASILGLQSLIPVQSPENLPKFIQFVLDHDLNNGGNNPSFFEAYPQSVLQILQAYPPAS